MLENINIFCGLTPTSLILSEIKRIDRLLDQEVHYVQILLQQKNSLDGSLINEDLVHLYNEMLTLSYALKLWLLSGLVAVTNDPEEFLLTIRSQFELVLSLLDHEVLDNRLSSAYLQLLPYQGLIPTI